ncbi:hypothetical protein [Aeromonas hydrophila]|uniref:hypothetical protein n=1 Tax=Aeromonas hydrophila TaxID=644 RepID=UPI0030D40364
MTKQIKIDPKLQEYLNSVKAQCKPDPQELQRRIDDAKARHLNYLEVFNHGHLLIVTLQEKIVEGYRYELGPYNYHAGGSGFIRIRLIKPESVIKKEIEQLERDIKCQYHKDLESQMNERVEQLMKDAAEEAAAAAAQAARKEQEEMAEKLKAFLLS